MPKTRTALFKGALEVMAVDGPDTSIDSITERANVAHGTFYDHFESRRDLQTQAMTHALEEFNSLIDDQMPQHSGAAEELALRFRHFGRMPELRPTLAAAFSSAGGFESGFTSGFMAKLDAVIDRGMASGEFNKSNAASAFATITGSAGWLVAVRTSYPHNGTDRVDAVAEFLLGLLGVDADQAHRICQTKHPQLPARKSRSLPARPIAENLTRRAIVQQDRSRKTRNSIVLAALNLLAEEGTNISIDRITTLAGTSKGSFYRYFANKGQLFEAASIAGMQEWEDYASARTSALTDPVDRFILSMRLYGRLPDSHPHVARAFFNLGNFAAGYPTGTEPDYQVLYDRVIETGIFAPDPRGTGFLTLAGALEWLVTQRVETLRSAGDVTDSVLDFVLPGFGLSTDTVKTILDRPIPTQPSKADQHASQSPPTTSSN